MTLATATNDFGTVTVTAATTLLVRQDRGALRVVLTGRDRPAWLEIDLDAIAGNVEALIRVAAPAQVMAVLKADAYGHGAVRVARTVLHHGATALATAVLSEAADLRAAGLDRINVSLDTLDKEKFRAMTRRDDLHRVLDGIDAALAAGFTPVKVNAVVQRGVNDDEIVALATFGRDKGVEVRFIEFMPLDAQGHWLNEAVVGQDEIVAKINEVYPLEQVPARGAAPADRWRYLDGKGTVGVIPTVTKPFCGDCDRVRLTADGQFRTCLFATDEFDVRGLLRSGATDDEIEALLRRAVGTKWAGHRIGDVAFVRPRRSMSQIGG